MFTIKSVFSLVIFALLSFNIVFAQPNISPSQEFRFIATTKIGTFDKELNDAAKQGYQFVRLAKAFNDTGLGGLLAREKEGEGRKYEYKVLATNKISTMK